MNDKSYLIKVTPRERQVVAKDGDWGLYETKFVMEKAIMGDTRIIEVTQQPLLESTTLETIELQRLLKLITTYFNMEELKNICFQLNIDLEELSPGNKEELVRELLLYLNRQGLILELLRVAKQLRPNTDWELQPYK